MEISGKNKNRFTCIRPRIVLTISILFAIILAIISFVVNFRANNLFVKDQKENLLSLTEERATHIQTLLNNQKELVLNLAASQVFRDFLSTPTVITNYNSAKDLLDRTITANQNISEFFLLDTSGKVVLTTDGTPLGADKSQDEYFLNAKKDAYIKGPYNSETIGEVNYTISAPITNDQTGQLEGVVVARFKPDDLYVISENRIGLGKTGENFLINSDLYFISPSYYLGKDVIFTKKDDAQNARECYEQKEVDEITKNGYTNLKPEDHVLEYKDYRNVAILGTHAYIPETGWCLIGKIDQAEVFQPINNITWTIIIIGLLALVATVVISYILAARITRPLEVLHHCTEKIAAGDLNYKVGTSVQDEIGQLSREFDNMTAKIKQSHAEVDQKVEEQTREITEKAQDMENQQKAILNILEDTDEDKNNIAELKAKDESMLTSIGDGVIAVDENKKIILVNSQAENLLGFKKEELLNRSVTDVVKIVNEKDQNITDLDRPVNKIFKTHQKMTSRDLYYVRKDKTKFPVLIITTPIILGGKFIGAIDVFHDITHEREVDKAKTEFVSLASHQLRTPLSAINWYTEMLIAGDAGKLNPEQKKYLDEVYKGNQRMVELVNSLLNVSRLELGTFAVEPVPTDFIETSKSVVKELVPQINKKKLVVKENYPKILEKISADPKLLRIIFQNLLSNAVKYTPDKGSVTVSIEKKELNVLIKIADTGFGIPKAQQNQIFTKLFRADNVREKDTEGTGLGLYLVRQITENTGGKVWFESVEGKGTTFFVEIPLSGMKKKEGTKGLEESVY